MGDVRFSVSKHIQFAPIIQELAQIHKFAATQLSESPLENSPFSIFAMSTPRSVVEPAPWCRNSVARAATEVDDCKVFVWRVYAGKGLPIVERGPPKGLRNRSKRYGIYPLVREADWDPSKPFGSEAAPATKKAEGFAKQTQGTASLIASLSVYLQWRQGFVSGALVKREKVRVALLARFPPPPHRWQMDDTLAGAMALSNYLIAAIYQQAHLETDDGIRL